MSKVIWSGQATVGVGGTLGAVKDPTACDMSKKQSAAAGASRTDLLKQIKVLDQEIALAEAMGGNEELVANLKSQRQTMQSSVNGLTATIVDLTGKIAFYCQELPQQPPPGPGIPAAECSETKACPNPKQECVSGKCLDKCPTGYTRDAAGLCQAPPLSTSGASDMNWGVAALAGAALVGLYFAFRPPKDMPAPENRLGDNPWFGEPIRHSRAAKQGWAKHCPARCCAAASRRGVKKTAGPGIALGAFASPSKSKSGPVLAGFGAMGRSKKLASNPCGCDECDCEG